MMLILKEGEVYFLDRDNSVFTSDKFFFPRRKSPDEHIFDTLVDGVSLFSCLLHMIYDKVFFQHGIKNDTSEQ